MTRTAGPKQQLRVSCPRSHPGLRAPPSAVPGSPAPSGSPVRHGAPVAPGGTVCEGRAGRGRDRRPGRSFPVPSRPVPSSHPGSPGARWGKVLARPPDRRRRGGRCRTLLNTSRSSSSSSSASTSAAASSGPRAVPRAPAARCESTPGPSPPAGSGGPGSRPSACILPCERGRRPRHSRSPRDRNWRLPRPPLAAAGPGGAPSAQEWKRRREGRAGSERGRVGSLPAGPGSGRGGTAAAASAEAGRGGSTPTGVFVAARGTPPGPLSGLPRDWASRPRDCRWREPLESVCRASVWGPPCAPGQPPALPRAAPGRQGHSQAFIPALSGLVFFPPGRRPGAATGAAGETHGLVLCLLPLVQLLLGSRSVARGWTPWPWGQACVLMLRPEMCF